MTNPHPFKFSFSPSPDDDVNSDEENAAATANTSTAPAAALLEPKTHGLVEMLSTLPSKISYSTLAIRSPGGNVVRMPRRELFDVRMQLMAEDDGDGLGLLAGLGEDDIRTNVYEGGLKSWECSVDLVGVLADDGGLWGCVEEEGLRVLELGCGTALPTLYLFQQALLRHTKAPRFSVADYNADVLRLVTVPNLLLSWAMVTSTSSDPWPEDDDLEITPDLLQGFVVDLDARGIVVDVLSGAWGPGFVELITVKPWLVLASETIYSPSSLPAFTQTLIEVLDRSDNRISRALVAAKMVYFGVGGGVQEFLRLLENEYRYAGEERYAFDTFKVAEKSGGVARVVLELPVR